MTKFLNELKKYPLIFIGILVLVALVVIYLNYPRSFSQKEILKDDFSQPRQIEETAKIEESKDNKWWLASGANLNIEDGIAKTIQGELPNLSYWRQHYSIADSLNSDQGYRPQNLFSLINKTKTKNSDQEISFYLENYHLSDSPRRNSSNGIFLLNRYQSSNNFYALGLRVDGSAAINKQIDGRELTLAEGKVIEDRDYDHEIYPNLIPVQKWFNLKAEVKDIGGGKVNLKLWASLDKQNGWQLLLETIDDGTSNGKVISQSGYGGLKTDFMDMKFDDYAVTNLK